MGRRGRAGRARKSSPGTAAGLDRQLAELEQELSGLEDCAQGRLPDVEPPAADTLEPAGTGPDRGSGRDPAHDIAAARTRLVRLHARIEALDPELTSSAPRRRRRFRRNVVAEPGKQPAGARLVAAKLAEAGAPNQDVDAYLHDTFTLDDRPG